MKLYLFMALEGSLCTLLYMLFKWLSPYEWSLRQRQFFLRINMLLYLIPIPALFYQGRTLWIGIGRRVGISKTSDTQAVLTHPNKWKESLNITTGKLLREITVHRYILDCAVVVMLIMLVVLAAWLIYFVLATGNAKKNMSIVGEKTVGKKKIPVALTSSLKSPAVVGVFRQVILLPEAFGENAEGIITHESQHILHRDGFFKGLSWLVLSIHWYNPMVHYLYREHGRVNEMRCDQRATLGMSEQEKKRYMNYIVESATETGPYHRVRMNLGGNGRVLNERMNRIMNRNVKKTWKKCLAVVTMAVCLVVSSTPAMAYEESKNFEGKYDPANGWDEVSFMQFVTEQNNSEIDLSSLDFSHSHVIFIDQSGNVFECEDLVEGRVFCLHDYVAGTVAFHEAYSDGSCLVTTFYAMRCDICGKIVQGNKKYDEFYYTCPHTEGHL